MSGGVVLPVPLRFKTQSLRQVMNTAYAVHECACFAGCTNWKWRSCELVSGGVVPSVLPVLHVLHVLSVPPVPLSFNDSVAEFRNAQSSDS